MPREEATTTRQKVGKGMQELKRLRDEIRLDLRRATEELREEWRDLEKKLPDASAAAEQLREATAEIADRLVDEVRRFRARLQGAAGPGQVTALMSTPAVTCRETDSLARAITVMWERDVGFLPVVDEGGRIAGTLTDRDSAIAGATRDQRFDEILVSTVMSKEVVTVSLEQTPAQVLALLRRHQIRRLPVADDGRPVGVISLADVARFCLGAGPSSGVPSEEIVEALATIARPRESDGDGRQ